MNDTMKLIIQRCEVGRRVGRPTSFLIYFSNCRLFSNAMGRTLLTFRVHLSCGHFWALDDTSCALPSFFGAFDADARRRLNADLRYFNMSGSLTV